MNTVGAPIRQLLFSSLAAVTSLQLGLRKLALAPEIPFETIARSTISLATPGLYDAIDKGQIDFHRSVVQSMSSRSVTLSDGTDLPADVVICGTGWTHDVPSFLPEDLVPKLTDSRGNWLFYRHILPIGVPDLSFIGFASSLFCPLTAEVSALWLAAHLAEQRLLSLPTEEEQRRLAEQEARWLEQRSNGKHAKATSIVPFSMSFIDELLGDLGVGIGWWDYFKEWILPINPSACEWLRPIRGLQLSVTDKRILQQVLQRKAALEVAVTAGLGSDLGRR